jgi:molybdenum cofactor cytidylyltransferase
MFEQFKSWLNAKPSINIRQDGELASAGLLLAAGRGARFDASGKQNKLLAQFMGSTVVEQSAANLAAVLQNKIAVIRPDATALRKKLESQGYRVVECPDAASGMGHSLAWGTAEAMKAFDIQILVVALADMPSVKTKTIQLLLAASRQSDDIVAPTYQGKRGNPVVFRAKHFEALSRLSGDRGASHLLKTLPVNLVEVEDPGIHQDIDSPDDLKK